MGNFVENRPIQCRVCGFQVNGQESVYNNGRQTVHECRWVCHNCGCLVRCDERVIKEENEEQTSQNPQ